MVSHVPARTTVLLLISIMLLIASMVLNIHLWEQVREQGNKIYAGVVGLIPPPPIVEEPEVPTVGDDELTCMAQNIYFESANESDLGKIAVAMVVLNRVNSPDFPNNICEVVWQPSRDKQSPKSCQFSWTCDGKPDKVRDSEKYQSILALSRDILKSRDTIVDIVDGALYYHAVYVKPHWAKYFKRVTRIDTHIFYKNKES